MGYGTRLPPLEPSPLDLPRGREEGTIHFDDATKSLAGESKFIPLGKPLNAFTIEPKPFQPTRKDPPI